MTRLDSGISGSLEDYLETIYLILEKNAVARVRDIAELMDVSPASVTPAMKRLAEKGLISYREREYIKLTEHGLEIARGTLARHNLLTRFLMEILGISKTTARHDACAMEHHLSQEAMERFTAFFEFMASNPETKALITRSVAKIGSIPHAAKDMVGMEKLTDIPVGTEAEVLHVAAESPERIHLLYMGFIPGSIVVPVRPGSSDLPCIVNLDGHEMKLERDLAECVIVRSGNTKKPK